MISGSCSPNKIKGKYRSKQIAAILKYDTHFTLIIQKAWRTIKMFSESQMHGFNYPVQRGELPLWPFPATSVPYLTSCYVNLPTRKQDKTNKSFSYQNTQPLHSLLVCILNFDNKISKIFSKVTIYLENIWEKHILYINQGPQLGWKVRKSKM